jgi:C_GCAxxG_C_C family probable redox protein
MSESERISLPRREFMISVPFLALGAKFLESSHALDTQSQVHQELLEQVTSEEAEWIQGSSMAKELLDYFGKDYSCAESLFMVSLRFLEKPEDLVWVAAGFGGGLGHRDLCGFLTAGIMAIGLASGMLSKERKEAKEYCKNAVNQYWDCWVSLAPLHCSDIREKRKSSKACTRLGQLAAAKTEELIAPTMNPE